MACKSLIIFDLDGTLTLSKSNLSSKMSNLLANLLLIKKVAIVSGGSYKQFQNQFLNHFHCPKQYLKNLFLFPTCSTSFYRYKKGWQKVYEQTLSAMEKDKIFKAFKKMFQELNYKQPEKTYGKIIEDRKSQITFSALGQQAPLELKKTFDSSRKKRLKMKKVLEKYIPEFEIRIGGTTSIDVTRKGIDKAYAIEQIGKYLQVLKKEMLFIGDALFEGGNDWPVKKTGVECVQVSGPERCMEVINRLIKE